ncbi:lamin Tail domain protein, partial [Vibrio parahaemolyticus V-223/04]
DERLLPASYRER